MGIQLSDWVENIVGKGEIARYEQVLLFSQCFKSCLLLMRQIECLWSKGLTIVFNIVFLTHSLIHHFETVPKSKKMETSTEIWLLTLHQTF